MDVEVLKKLKQITEKNISELGKKSDLNPTETKALKDAFEFLDMVECKLEECEMKEKGYSQYSGHEEMYATPRRYNITSYSHPRMRMSYEDRSYYGPMVYGESMMDNSMRMYPDSYENRGYSRHSIGDRAIACLEKEMDMADSDYERKELRRFIGMIRSAE